MTRGVDYLIDVGETAQLPGRGYRKELIKSILPCEYGTTAIPNIEPIQGLPRYFYLFRRFSGPVSGLKKHTTTEAGPVKRMQEHGAIRVMK